MEVWWSVMRILGKIIIREVLVRPLQEGLKWVRGWPRYPKRAAGTPNKAQPAPSPQEAAPFAPPNQDALRRSGERTERPSLRPHARTPQEPQASPTPLPESGEPSAPEWCWPSGLPPAPPPLARLWAQRKAFARYRRNLLFAAILSALLAGGAWYLAGASLRSAVIAGVFALGLVYGYFEFGRTYALNQAVQYLADLFDYTERGTPIHRHAERLFSQEENNAEQKTAEEEILIPVLHTLKEQLERFYFGPLSLGQRMLLWLGIPLRPGPLPRLHFRFSESSPQARDALLQSLWMGNVLWWHIDAHTVVVLERIGQGFRFIMGPSLDESQLNAWATSYILEENFLQAVHQAVQPHVYQRHHERLHKIVRCTGLQIDFNAGRPMEKPFSVRTRDGIRVHLQPLILQVTIPDPQDPRFLKFLTQAVIQETGQGQPPTGEDALITWLKTVKEALSGNLLRDVIRRRLSSEITSFFRKHYLGQVTFYFEKGTFEALERVTGRKLRKPGPSVPPEELERTLREQAQKWGLEVKVVQFTARLPKALQTQQEGLLREVQLLRENRIQLAQEQGYKGWVYEGIDAVKTPHIESAPPDPKTRIAQLNLLFRRLKDCLEIWKAVVENNRDRLHPNTSAEVLAWAEPYMDPLVLPESENTIRMMHRVRNFLAWLQQNTKGRRIGAE